MNTFRLTNEQRRCFALKEIPDTWEMIKAKPSPYDDYEAYLWLDGDTVVKYIASNDTTYCEYELNEKVTPDRKYLLPKTEKGKPVLLSSSSIQKRNGTGMRLDYCKTYIYLRNEISRCHYFTNSYLNDNIRDIDCFSRWVDSWCRETTQKDVEDITQFSKQKRIHVKYQEGDVFRFRIGRRLYGYGRILLDFHKLRKSKKPFWDILMCRPLICSVYHIVTDRKDVSPEELKALPSLPSDIFMDDSLYYGEFQIIGNIPVTDNEDYPIMYGNSIKAGEKGVCYQRGKTYRRIENESALYDGFINNGVGFYMHIDLDVLRQCIKENSNQPYWTRYRQCEVDKDLRNPVHAEKLQKIREQMGL